MYKIAYMNKRNSFSEKLSEILNNTKEDFGKGIIIETGAGSALYNILCKHPNTASKLVKYAFSPTDWQYTKDKYFISDKLRAVCLDTVTKILDIEIDKNTDNSVKWYFVDSVQIGNDPNTQTHGWIAYKYANTQKYYHFSIDNSSFTYNRKELLDIIEQIFLDIFLSKNSKSITSGYIDIILDINHLDLSSDVIDNLFLSELSSQHGDDNYICIYNKKLIRFNDLIRNFKSRCNQLVIFKGSFDPIHTQHYNMYKKMLEMNMFCVFMISLNNRDKSKNINTENIIKRIEVLKELNIPIILNRKGMYSDCINYLNNHFELKNVKINFLLGDDIMLRLISDNDIEADNFKGYDDITFYVMKRSNDHIRDVRYDITYLDMSVSNISSTDVRNSLKNDKICDIYRENKNLLDIVNKVYGN